MAHFVMRRPVFFIFDGVLLHDSLWQGMKGQAESRPDGFLRLEAEILGIGLEDLAPLNPGNLKGSTGEMRGKITLETKPGGEPVFMAELHAQRPGGKIPSRFFEGLLPYLPQVKNRQELEAIIRIAGLVSYNEADFTIASVRPGLMKVFLHMRIPDYNLNLNLNMQIRTDEENFFQALPGWMRTFKAEAS